MRHWRRSTVRLSYCVQQSNVWVGSIAILMRIREVTYSNLSLYTDRIFMGFSWFFHGIAMLVFSYWLFYDSLPCSTVCCLQTLTMVNLNIVVRTAAPLLIMLCGQCIWMSPVVHLCAFGRACSWLVASPLSFRTTRQKICSYMYTPSGIPTSDPSAQAAEDITSLNSCGECESHESPANMLSLSFVLSTRDVKFRKIAFRNVICF